MGVTKLLKKKGDGRTFPKPGQKVTVHYTGYLGVVGGAKFDSSRDRKEPFEFIIGQGQVIQGWDEGVAKMTVGERAYLICTSDVAYGAEGSPGGIPPNSTLIFDVELLKVKKN